MDENRQADGNDGDRRTPPVRTDRRTFLAKSVRTGTALTAAGAVMGSNGGAAGASARTNRTSRLRFAKPASDAPDKSGPPKDLWVNGLARAIGVDADAVEFSWRLDDARRGAAQRSYRIVLWQEPGDAGRDAAVPPKHPHWDSGWVTSPQQAFVPYPKSTATSTSVAPTPLVADTRYRWTVAIKDHENAVGPWATPITFTTGLRRADWTADWLSPGPTTPTPEIYTYLRTSLQPHARRITRATAYVAAAHKYQLWVNGTKVDTGPCFSFPDESYVQATDVTDQIKAGTKNTIGLLHHWYGAGNGRPAAVPGALLQLTVHHNDGTRETFGTNGTWRELPAEWLPAPPRNTEAHDFIEIIDARRAPRTWAQPTFDDSTWKQARVIGPVGTAPFTDLYAQRTRIHEHAISPTATHRLPSGAVVADFGKVYAARPVVDFRQGADGRTVSVVAGYLLDPDGSVSTTHGTQGTDLSFTFIQRDGVQSFEPFTFFGFRYLQISGADEDLDPHQITAMARHAAMPERGPGDMPAATFATSNRTLDRVWELCTHSALYASHEQFVDTPTRQKGQFVLDATNESQAIMHAFGDRNQSWQGLRDGARGQARYWPGARVNELYPDGQGATTIPDFTEIYVEWLWRYFVATGDVQTAVTYLSVVENIVRYVTAALDPLTGLVTNLPGGAPDYTYGIVDWPPNMRYGYDMTTSVRTTVNVLAVNVFERASGMAALAGKTIDAAAYTQRAKTLTAAINARLIGPSGVYIDGLHADGSQSSHASQQANALALCYGIVPTASVSAVGAHVASLGIAVGPDLGLTLVRGLHAAGLDEKVVDILTNPKGPGWANILSRGATFCWETWTPTDLLQDSMSHGWGSGALVGMVESVLGITHLATLGSTAGTFVGIAPPSSGVSHAAGEIPTVAGPVRVSWTRRRSTLSLSLTLPPNSDAVVTVPATGAQAVTESGSPVAHVEGIRIRDFSENRLTLFVSSGTYRFQTRIP